MCKILTFTNGSNLDLNKTLQVASELLSKSERDGLGFAAQGETNVFGSRTLTKELSIPHGHMSILGNFICSEDTMHYGNAESVSGPLIVHGRTSTNKLNLTNTHPIVIDNYHLIHNGVVGYDGSNYTKYTSNDSEDLLKAYIDGGIESIEKYITGYYAFTCINPDGSLTILRDSIASLYITWSPSACSYIIATTRDLISQLASRLNLRIESIQEITPESYAIFKGNDILTQGTFYSRGYDYKQGQLASKSLGRDLLSTTDYNGVTSDNWEYYQDSDIEAEYEFQDLIQDVDDSCSIYNGECNQITASEFHRLPLSLQKECYIETADLEIIYFQDFIANRISNG